MINDRYITLTRCAEENTLYVRKSDISAIYQGTEYTTIYVKDFIFHVKEPADVIRLRISQRA